MTTQVLGRLAALAAVLLAAPGAGRATGPAQAGAPPAPSRASPPAPATPFPPETIAALTAKYEADYVIEVLPGFLLLAAKRPGPELSFGEPKTVALVIDAKGQLVSQLELAWSMGDAGVSLELGHDYLGPGLIRTRQHDSSCSMESDYNECTESTSYTTYKLGAKGAFEQVTLDGRYCDRGRGEELELVADLEKPLQTSVTYRSKGKPSGLKLRVVEVNPTLTRLAVRFPKSPVVYALALTDDYTRLTSTGSDGSALQTFTRADCGE